MADTNQTLHAAANGARPLVTRPTPPRPTMPPPAMERSEEMLSWVAHYDNTMEQNRELKTSVTRLNTTVRGLEARVQTITDELRRVTRERNDYQARYQQMKAHLSDAASILIEAVEEKGHDK